MPRLALLLFACWFLSLFVFRTALQWWRTGSTGVKGYSGRVGSLEWSGGFLTSLGLAFGGTAPIAVVFEWPASTLLFSSHTLHLLGAFLTVVGTVGAVFAQVEMGKSWRVGVDESDQTDLITHGMFHWARNPFFSFLFLSIAGLVLLVPNALSLLAAALTTVGIQIQVRTVEEPYLDRVHGSTYETYCSRTGRFIPGICRKTRS